MAKLLLPVAAVFFLYALCSARVPIDLSGFEVALPDPEPKTLVHSSEQLESDSAVLVEWKPEKAESAGSTAQGGPLTMISFRPTDHQFRPFPLRSRRGHRCRHQHRQNHIRQLMPGGPRFPDSEVPYGNDMIVSHEEKSGFDPEFRGEGREMSASTDQVGPSFHHEDWDVEKWGHRKKHHFRQVDREEKEREEEDEDEDDDDDEDDDEDDDDDDDHDDDEERKEHKKKHQRYPARGEREREEDDDDDDDEERREHKKKKHHHRYADREEDEHEDKHDHDHDHDHDHKHKHFHGYKHKHFHGYKHKRAHEHEHEGGFMKTISKFLNLF